MAEVGVVLLVVLEIFNKPKNFLAPITGPLFIGSIFLKKGGSM
jgi:hypothetical protein